MGLGFRVRVSTRMESPHKAPKTHSIKRVWANKSENKSPWSLIGKANNKAGHVLHEGLRHYPCESQTSKVCNTPDKTRDLYKPQNLANP